MMRVEVSNTCTISGRERCSVSMICMRAMNCCFCCSRLLISSICLSSSRISVCSRLLRERCASIIWLTRNQATPATTSAPMNAPNMPTPKAFLRSVRCCSRHGSRFMRGMSVEAPQRQTAGGQQGSGIAVHVLGTRARGNAHLAERIALLGLDADAALHHIGHAGDVGAAAAHQHFLRLLAAGAGGQVELQRTADLLGHVVDEWIEHVGLVVGRQAAFLL